MSGYVLSEPARRDLRDIRDYIARDSIPAARRVLDELISAFQAIAKMPEMGHFREDITDAQVRFWPVRSYLIIYRSEGTPVPVVRVIHGARDISKFDVTVSRF